MFAITLTAEEFACLQQYRPEILDVLKDTPSQGDDFLTHLVSKEKAQEIAIIVRSKAITEVWNQFPYSLKLKLLKLYRQFQQYRPGGNKNHWHTHLNRKHKLKVSAYLEILNEPA